MTRDELIARLYPTLGTTARHLKRKYVLPQCTHEELACAGSTGLMDAVDTWDASRGRTLESWVDYKARNAMFDWYRNTYKSRHDGPKRRLQQAQSLEAEDASGYAPISYLRAKEEPVSKVLEREEQHDILHKAVGLLSKKRQEAVRRIDLCEEEQRGVAKELGVSDGALAHRRRTSRSILREHFLNLGGDRG